ncbi:Aminomethyltransferase folate-binding domain-containing protein [Azospirillaceae bacterium]
MTSETASPAPVLKTPLNALHRECGGRMVPFAGYEMPVQFPAGILKEHLHTRSAAGLFDVSHMGQVRLVGGGAAAALESLVPGDIQGLAAGRTRYTLFLNERGGILDDLMAPMPATTCSWWSMPTARPPTSPICAASSATGWGSRCWKTERCWRSRGRRRPRCWRGIFRRWRR